MRTILFQVTWAFWKMWAFFIIWLTFAGAKGTAGSKTLNALADSCIENDYRGVMVWYASVPNGLVYGVGWDASDPAYQQSFIDTMNKFKPYNN